MKGKVFPCFISFYRGADTNFTIKFYELVKRCPREKLAIDIHGPALGQEACLGLRERRWHNERGFQVLKCLGFSVFTETLSRAGKLAVFQAPMSKGFGEFNLIQADW